MDAGVAAVKGAVVPREAVGIRIGLGEPRRLERTTGLDVVLDQPCAPFVAGDHPDGVLVRRHAMRSRHGVRDEELGLPRLGIDAQDPAQPQRGNPQLAVDVFDAMTAAAVLARPERYLAMADRLG